MNQQDRISAILAKLETVEDLSVADISEMFGVSKDTARRDIIKLEEMGVVERFHGGIRAPYLLPLLEDYKERLVMNPDIKKRLGKAASKLVRNNDSVMLDLSATVQFVGENITAKGVLAVTNSIDTALALMKTDVDRIYLTGGYLNRKFNALLGMGVLERIKTFHFNIAFIGASAVRPDGIYYMLEDDIIFKQNVIQLSDKVVLVADHTKFTEVTSYRMGFQGIDLFITDQWPPAELQAVLDSAGIEVMVVENDNYVK